MKMNRRSFLITAAASGAASMMAPAMAQKKPNVIVIVADDLGYAEIGKQGSDIPTPNIDSIASNGVRFTDGYVSCPVCSPTRAGIMTGRYQQRFGHELNPGPAGMAAENFGLPLTETTLANQMKKLGYVTGMVGKWHLGYRPEFNPVKRGFDEFFGFTGGAHSYLDARADGDNPILRGTEPVDEKAYLTDAFAREASGFVRKHAGQPFFLYLTFNAVHAPLQGAQKYLDRFSNVNEEKRRTFSAMMSAMDDGIGQVLSAVREKKIENDTLIFFISDNGGPTPQTSSRNNPLHGTKGQVYEGGIRVPFLLQWKGTAPAGKVYNHPVIALDIAPTAIAAAGGSVPMDAEGVDLMPFLKEGNPKPPHDALFWRFGPQWAVRQGDWKLLHFQDSSELYNLKDDIGELKDVASAQPEKAKSLKAVWDAWNKDNIEPLWTTRRAASARGPAAQGGARRRRRRQP